MDKLAQERGKLSKLKQVLNVKRHLTRGLDSKYRKLSDNTETLDTLIRQTLIGDKDNSFVRKVRLAQSNFNRDNYLQCGIEIDNAVQMLTDAKVYLDKANLELADKFPEIIKSRFEESGGKKEDLERILKKNKLASLEMKAKSIKDAGFVKDAGISDWFSNLKTDMGDAAYNASHFSLWKKLFTKSAPVVKATGKIVSDLQSVAKVTIDLLGKMAQELSASDLENYFSISSKLSKEIEKFIKLYDTYKELYLTPLINKINVEKSESDSKLINIIKSRGISTTDIKDYFDSIKIMNKNSLKELSSEDLEYLKKSLVGRGNIPEFKEILVAIEKIKKSNKDTFDSISKNPKMIDNLSIASFVELSNRKYKDFSELDAGLIIKLINRLDKVIIDADKDEKTDLNNLKKTLFNVSMGNKESSMSFSHIKNADVSEQISEYLNKGKISQALKVIDYEMALVKDDKKVTHILDNFKNRIQGLK